MHSQSQPRPRRSALVGVLAPALLLSACDKAEEKSAEGTDTASPTRFRPVTEQLLRASMALRGIRPSLDEYDAVQADPDALEGLVDGWLTSAEFGATVRDMHAEQLRIRSDLYVVPPPVGDLDGYDFAETFTSTNEAPLVLVEEVVLDGRPYTEIVTSQTVRADEITAAIWGYDYDASGDEWQAVEPPDDRLRAGILSDGGLWLRHQSASGNNHRGRANLVASALLCEDFLTRDIVLTSEIDLSDPEAVADALMENPDCVSCHQSLDPLAAFFWGVVPGATTGDLISANTGDCSGRDAALCYPLQLYYPERAEYEATFGLRTPGYYGLGDDVSALGSYIASDPRFAACTVKRFYGYLTRTPVEDVPLQSQAELLEVLEGHSWDARELARAVVLSEPFTATTLVSGDEREVVGLQAVRPEQYNRMIEDLTGFSWLSLADDLVPCTGDVCLGEVDLAATDTMGFRSMAGGMDGYRVTLPTTTTTPTKVLTLSRWAAEAAGHVVDADLGGSSPRLLTEVSASDTSESAVRDQLATLHLRILGDRVDADSGEVDESWELFEAGLSSRGDAEGAWKLVLSGMLQDPRILLY